VKEQIFEWLQFKEGKLSVRYLGVPLIYRKLTTSDCEVLLKKITAIINSWTSRKLSFARRLQLLSSVLYSIQVYWSSIFILPKKVISSMKQKFNRFLCGGNDSNMLEQKKHRIPFVSQRKKVA
jgi:hypothetical protein